MPVGRFSRHELEFQYAGHEPGALVILDFVHLDGHAESLVGHGLQDSFQFRLLPAHFPGQVLGRERSPGHGIVDLGLLGGEEFFRHGVEFRDIHSRVAAPALFHHGQ